MVKFVEYTGSDGKTKMVTEGSYQQAVRSGKVSAEQHASAKGAKSSSDKYVQSSSSKSSSSSSSKSQQEVIPSNTQITFTDIGGKTQTTDYSTYKKWEKAGNVKSSNINEVTDRLTGDSSIGADTVAKLIDEQVRSGQITAEEGAKRKGEAYASEGAIVQATTGYTYKSYSSPNTYVEQQYINPRVQEFLYSGKTTPEAINQEMSKDYVQRTAFVSKYGGSFVGQDNLPRRYTDEYVYSPLAKFGTDNYSQSQIDLMSKAEGEYMGRNDGRYLQLFDIDNNGIIVYNSNLSPSLKAEAERLANKYQINVGDKLNISSQRPNQSSTTSTSNDQFNNPSDNLANYENEIYKNDLYKPAGSNVYYEASGDKYVPKYIELDGDTKALQTRVVNGETEYFYEPPLPKDIIKIGDNQYKNIQTNVVYTEKNGSLIPSYLMKEYDSSKQMSGYDKIFFTEKDGEYFIENTTETITSQIPEGFTKVNTGLELPDILKQKMGIKEGILKDLPRPDIYENEGIYYKTQGDKLIPSYTYYNGEKIYASKNKTTGEYEFLISREIKSQTNTERLSEVQNKIKDYKNETGIVRDINNFFDDVALKVVDTTSKYHSNVGKAKDMLLNAKPSGVDKTIYADGHLGADLFSEVIFSVGEVLVTSPTKIIDTAVRGGYEQQLYKLQDPLSNIKFSSNPIIDLTSKEIIKPQLNLKSLELTEKDYTNFNVPFVNYELKFNKAQLDSLILGTESSLHALPYVLGGLNALAQISAKTSFTGLTKLTPNIAKQEGLVKTILSNPYGQAGVIGATAGAGIESYQILFDGKEFKPKDFLMTMARSSGSAMGFVAIGDITSTSLVSGWDRVFKVDTFTIKNPQLTQVKGDLKADYGFQFQKVQLREPFRSWVSGKDVSKLQPTDLKLYPFESVKMMGVQKILYKSDIPISMSFTGRNEWSMLRREYPFYTKDFTLPSGKPKVLVDGQTVIFTPKQDLSIFKIKTDVPILMNKYSNNIKLDIPKMYFNDKPISMFLSSSRDIYIPKNVELIMGSNKYLNIDPLTKYMIQNNKAVYTTTFGKTYYGNQLISYDLGESLSYKIGTTQTFYKGDTKNILYDYDVSRSIGQGWSISPDTKLTSGAFLKNAYHSAGESYGFVLTKGTSVQHVMSDVFKSNYYITNTWAFTEPTTEFAKIHTFEKTLGKSDSELAFQNKDLNYNFKTGKLGSDSLYSVQEKTIGNQNINKLSASGQQDYTFKTINVDKSKLNVFTHDLIGVRGGSGIDRVAILNKPTYQSPSNIPYPYVSQFNNLPYITFYNPTTSINTIKPLFVPLPVNRNIVLEEVVNRKVNEAIYTVKEQDINKMKEKYIKREIYPSININKDISRVKEIDKIKDITKEVYIYRDVEFYTDRYYEETIPIKPIDPIPEIPITFPPYIIGGSPDPDYLRKTQRKKGGILDKRIRLSSISAGTFGTRARPEWRGTSLDTREDVLPARRYNSNQNTGWVTQIQTGIKKAKLVKQPKVKSAKLYKGSRSNTNKK